MELYKKTDDDIAREVNRFIKKARNASATWRDEAIEDFNFVAGHQWNYEDHQKLRDEKRPVITFNRCNVILSAILGLEANQRQEVKFNPRGNDNVAIAESLDYIGAWSREYGEIPNEEAQAFEDMLACGMGWAETRISYDEDLDGKILQDTCPPLEMYWDYSARKRNLTDASWVARKRKIPLDELKSLLKPGATVDLTEEDETETDDEFAVVDVKPVGDAYADDSMPEEGEERKGIPVTHFQWYEPTLVYRVQNPQTREIAELTTEDYKEKREIIDSMGIPIIKQQKRTYYYAFVAGKTLIEKGELPLQTGFTYKCITGKHDHVENSWYGIIRIAKDPQRWANKFFSTFIDILDSNAKGGIMAEIGSVADAREFEEKWARADSVIWTNANVLVAGKIQPKPVAQYPQMVDRLMTYAIQAIHDVTGVNLELLGAVDRAEVGVVVDSRKRSAYTILAPFFDALRNYRMQNALALMECVKKYIPLNRILEILPKNLQQFAQEIKNMDLARMKITIAESPQSDNNRYQSWLFISQLLPQLIQLQVPVPPSVIEYSPLPAGLIQEWKQMLQKPNPNKEIMQKLTLMEKEVAISKAKAETALKQAQTAKTLAESQQVAMEAAMGGNVFGQT